MQYVAGSVQDPCGLGAALVRPDGFVVWASGQHADPADARRVAAAWFDATPR